MNDVEIRKANHQRLYPFQFRRKAMLGMRFLYHCYQLLAVCPKALASWVLKHVLHCPPQSFYFRMQNWFSSIEIFCPQQLNVSSTVPPDPSTSTKLSRGCPRSIYQENITQAYDLGLLRNDFLYHRLYHFVRIKPDLTFTFCMSN